MPPRKLKSDLEAEIEKLRIDLGEQKELLKMEKEHSAKLIEVIEEANEAIKRANMKVNMYQRPSKALRVLKQQLLTMEIGHILDFRDYKVLRVPGGWLYNLPSGPVLVPYDPTELRLPITDPTNN